MTDQSAREINMNDNTILTHELVHRHAGNGYAAVQILPHTKSTFSGKKAEWVMVTDKWGKKGQAFLAARDHLEVYERSPGKDAKGKALPPEPVKLTDDELSRLTPLRDGIADGSIEIASTWFKQVQP